MICYRSESSSDEDDTLSWVEQRQLIKQSLRQTGSLPEQLNANQHKQLRPQYVAGENMVFDLAKASKDAVNQRLKTSVNCSRQRTTGGGLP